MIRVGFSYFYGKPLSIMGLSVDEQSPRRPIHAVESHTHSNTYHPPQIACMGHTVTAVGM